jgi:uncharacterized protein (DUF2147 family)
MGVRLIRHAAPALALACCAGAVSAAPVGANLTGVWRNPRGSVHVDIGPCGTAICGVVVWANDKAKEDARRAGTLGWRAPTS